jgi:hypothetical protein
MNISRFVPVVMLVLAMCTKEETTPRPYPRVFTEAVTNITTTGAVFHATVIYSSSEILDHGFLWSESSQPNFTNSTVIALGSFSGTGKFEQSVIQSFLPNKKYYVSAYCKSDKYTVFGDVASFIIK